MSRTAVIVGTSVAGVRTAQALRREGFDGRVVLIGAEAEPAYDKPPLSKQFLTAGDAGEVRVDLLRDDAHELDLDIRTGVAAERLDVADHRVVLADGRQVDFDACVVATGSSARPSPWGNYPGLHLLRSLNDARGLRDALRASRPIVIVGGGFIGAEVAASARTLGRDVTIVDPLEAPLSRLVGEHIGAVLAALHARHGVVTRFGTGVSAVRPVDGGLRVMLDDGSELEAGTVLVGIGASPNDAWLRSSGLLVDDGVVCDEYCRAVGGSDVYAAGDVARWLHRRHGERVRVEHWTNAVDQAACVAHNIAHPDDLRTYEPVEYVWSDQYDWKIQIAGAPSRSVDEHLVGDPLGAADGPRPQAAMCYADAAGELSGVVTLNWPRGSAEARWLLATPTAASEAVGRLADLVRRGRPARSE